MIDNDIGIGGKYVLIRWMYEKLISFYNLVKEELLYYYRRMRWLSKKNEF